ESAAEEGAEPAAVVLPERDHQAEHAECEAGAERAQVDERAADEHQPPDAEQRERDERGRGAEPLVEPVRDVTPDGPSVPAEPQHGREDEAGRDETEPPELRMVVTSGLLRALAYARGRARLRRPRRASLLPRRHGLAASAPHGAVLRPRL